jgi:hypothetical protein
MLKQKLINYYIYKFIKENLLFTIIIGLLMIILFFSLISSFILIFWYDWWWKLTISSGGLLWGSIEILKYKLINWLGK